MFGGWGHNVCATHRFCLVETLEESPQERMTKFWNGRKRFFSQAIAVQNMVKESHNGHRETHPYKRKKVTHRPPPALPHECGDRRNYRDRTANTYARSRVRERKTHFNPNSNGVGSRALRPAEASLRESVHRSGVRSPFEFGSVFSGRSAIQRNTTTRSSIKRQDSSKSIPSQNVVPLLKPN